MQTVEEILELLYEKQVYLDRNDAQFLCGDTFNIVIENVKLFRGYLPDNFCISKNENGDYILIATGLVGKNFSVPILPPSNIEKLRQLALDAANQTINEIEKDVIRGGMAVSKKNIQRAIEYLNGTIPEEYKDLEHLSLEELKQLEQTYGNEVARGDFTHYELLYEIWQKLFFKYNIFIKLTTMIFEVTNEKGACFSCVVTPNNYPEYWDRICLAKKTITEFKAKLLVHAIKPNDPSLVELKKALETLNEISGDKFQTNFYRPGASQTEYIVLSSDNYEEWPSIIERHYELPVEGLNEQEEERKNSILEEIENGNLENVQFLYPLLQREAIHSKEVPQYTFRGIYTISADQPFGVCITTLKSLSHDPRVK